MHGLPMHARLLRLFVTNTARVRLRAVVVLFLFIDCRLLAALALCSRAALFVTRGRLLCRLLVTALLLPEF